MANKTTIIGNEEEYDDVDRAIIEQANLLSKEEFLLMQMWFVQHADGLFSTIYDIDKSNEELVLVDAYDAEHDETELVVIQLDDDFIDLNEFAEEHEGYEQYKYYPFGDKATKCELVNWFYYASRDEIVHPKLQEAKDRIQSALQGLMVITYTDDEADSDFWKYADIAREDVEVVRNRIEEIIQEFGGKEAEIDSADEQDSEQKVFEVNGEFVRIDVLFFPDKPYYVLEVGTQEELIHNTMEDADPFPYDLSDDELREEIGIALGINE